MSSGDIGNVVQAIVNVDDRLRDVENKKPALQAWQVPAFGTGWSNIGGNYAGLAYWKDPWGVVHLRGRVTGGAFPSVIFTLPVKYRPENYLTFYVHSGGTVIEIRTDGTVNTVTGGSPVSLDVITFRAFQ